MGGGDARAAVGSLGHELKNGSEGRWNCEHMTERLCAGRGGVRLVIGAGKGVGEQKSMINAPESAQSDISANGAQPDQGGALRSWLFRHIWGEHAVIQPLGAWLLTAVFGLVVWLTIAYAPAAFVEAGPNASPAERGVIPVEWGRATIAFFALVAIISAFEPRF